MDNKTRIREENRQRQQRRISREPDCLHPWEQRGEHEWYCVVCDWAFTTSTVTIPLAVGWVPSMAQWPTAADTVVAAAFGHEWAYLRRVVRALKVAATMPQEEQWGR